MRYVQLRAFHYVAVHGGFSRAAEALHVTQPAISDQVRKLEAEYDIRLFDRHQKHCSVTDAGKQLLDITHRLFEVEQRARDYLTESRAVRTGTLKIIADSAHHMLCTLSAFRQQFPDVSIAVRVGNSEQVVNSLHSYDADIGVLGGAPAGNDYQSVQLSSTSIIAFAPANSKIGKRKSIRLKELARQPLVLREPGSKTRALLEDFAAQAGIKLQVKIEAEGREAVRDIVAAGGGVGIVSEAEFGQDARLVKIAISDAPLTMNEAIVCLRERRNSKLIAAFMSLAEEVAVHRTVG